MKKKTLNAQRSTFNVEWNRVRQDEAAYQTKMGNPCERKFDLKDRMLEFTARLVKMVDALPTSRTGNHIAGQLLRCGTSPFPNHGEVQAAESRKDFVHKLGICLKELKEIKRWIRLIARVELIPMKRVRPLLIETEELIRIFSTSIRTAERNVR
jgi:four helix bundle protein